MRIDITAHPAEDITLDLSGVRELAAQNERLTAELEEARKQPVALLPEITDAHITEWERRIKGRAAWGNTVRCDELNAILSGHFRQSAEARVKQTDEPLAARLVLLADRLDDRKDSRERNMYGEMEDVAADLRRLAKNWETLKPVPDETLAAAVARVERETRTKCVHDLRQWANTKWAGSVEVLADKWERGE